MGWVDTVVSCYFGKVQKDALMGLQQLFFVIVEELRGVEQIILMLNVEKVSKDRFQLAIHVYFPHFLTSLQHVQSAFNGQFFRAIDSFCGHAIPHLTNLVKLPLQLLDSVHFKCHLTTGNLKFMSQQIRLFFFMLMRKQFFFEFFHLDVQTFIRF